MNETRTIDWYFDFISPFAYFAWQRLPELATDATITYRPILLAGLLSHHGQKGPAEIGPKRRWTYRWCAWHAREHGLAFRMPAAHPFNSLPYLRLAIAAGSTTQAIDRIFAGLWTTGVDAQDPGVVQTLAQALNVDPARLAAPEVKQQLRVETEQACARGVFGVPTLAIGKELFWGADAMPMAAQYLADPASLDDDAEMQRVSALPIGAMR
ncbi:DSBA oxidoreductase [Salinisphaera sp. C84B14]|uniref:2-hydroxychromene-2-carboxylate isomerase n=1 Tax=Salinisphaera sp. C84B14 TaxID=1304155 RepID=UPI00333F756F